MKSSDMPAIYQSANKVSGRSQKQHYRLIIAQLAILIIVAGLTSVDWNSYRSIREPVAIGVAILVLVVIGLNGLVFGKKYDRIWFICRSIAESVKVESWRFMMRAPPYETADSDNRFINRLQEVLEIQRPLPSEFLAENPNAGDITDEMRKIRQGNISERASFYISNRLNDQRKWYSDRATFNQSKQNLWFGVFWAFQILAALIAILVIGIGLPALSSVGVLTTIAASAFSWREAKRFGELTQSYGMVSKELNMIASKSGTLSTETELKDLVAEVERIISREHTVWLARRL